MRDGAAEDARKAAEAARNKRVVEAAMKRVVKTARKTAAQFEAVRKKRF